MIYNAKSLRNKENLNNLGKNHGYYKQWAKKPELETILSKLGLSYNDVCCCLEKRDIDNETYYCIYVGIAFKEPIAKRLYRCHINGKISNSTFRRSIAAVVCGAMSDTQGTNDFIDLLKVEIFPLDLPVKTQDAEKEIQKIEKNLLNGKKLYPLNIQGNKHPMAPKKKLRQLRKEAASK